MFHFDYINGIPKVEEKEVEKERKDNAQRRQCLLQMLITIEMKWQHHRATQHSQFAVCDTFIVLLCLID